MFYCERSNAEQFILIVPGQVAEGQTRASRSFSFSSNRPNIWTSPISPPAGSAAHLDKHDIRWFTPPATWFLSSSPCCPVVLTKSLSQQILIGLHVPSLSSNGPHLPCTLYTPCTALWKLSHPSDQTLD